MADAVDTPFGSHPEPGMTSGGVQPPAPVRVLTVLLNIVTLMVVQYCLRM
jgi:hypothetical protein